jgi:RNA polymerase sigma factor (sigma-70 family)
MKTEGQLSTAALQGYLHRWRAGDASAMNTLLQKVFHRLRHLAVRMLRGFPNVQPFIDSDDLFQNSILRFMRTLQSIQPATTRDFFNLAAVHMRRELIDLSRRASRRIATSSLNTRNNVIPDDHGRNELDVPQPDDGMKDFALWVRFHALVDNLPVEEREVVGLIFYHGWTQQQVAELFQVSVRTIRRRWISACQRLRVGLQWDCDA